MKKIKKLILVSFIVVCSMFLIRHYSIDSQAYSDSWQVGTYLGACNYCTTLPNGDAHSGYVTVDSVTRRTCTTGAYVTFSCKCTGKCTKYRGRSVCGQTGYDSAAALGHAAGSYTDTKDGGHVSSSPTCTGTGSGYYIVTRKTKCSRCSVIISTTTFNSSYSIPALGHISPANYTYKNDGYHYKYCSRCSTQLEKQPNTYTVEYYSHDGTECGGSSGHVYDVAKNLTLAKNLNGIYVAGYDTVWSRSIDGPIQYTDGQSVVRLTGTQGDTIKLYADFKPHVYLVKLDSTLSNSKGTNIPADDPGTDKFYSYYSVGFFSSYEGNYSLDNEITEILPPVRTGYRFGGYYMQQDGKGQKCIDENGQIIVSNTTFTTEPTILYAYWIPNTYTVHFHPDKPSYATNNIVPIAQTSQYEWKDTYYSAQFTYNVTTLPSVEDLFSLKGWHCEKNQAWYSLPNKQGNVYAVGMDNLASGQGDIVNVYAGWLENCYRITFSGNDTDLNIYGDAVTTSFTGRMDDLDVYYDHDVILPECAFNKKGYTFKEWNTASDGSGQGYFPNITYSKPNFCEEHNASTTLYAIWEPISYDVVFMGNGAWNQLEPYRQTVRFDEECRLEKNRYTRLASDVGNVQALSQGYEFYGWAYDMVDTIPVYQDQDKIKNITLENEIRLYAIWKKDIILTLDLNGGRYLGSTNTMKAKYTIYNDEDGHEFLLSGVLNAYAGFDEDTGMNYSFRKSEEFEGREVQYRFTGWNLADTDTVPYVSTLHGVNVNLDCYDTNHTQKLKLYDSLTLYAAWEPELSTAVKIGRTLGDISQSGNGITVGYVTATPGSSGTGGTSVFNPGEQGFYLVKIFGGSRTSVEITFDQAMTAIYTASTFVSQDNLNLPYEQNTQEYTSASILPYTGLNRLYQVTSNSGYQIIRNTFFIPLYLGTSEDPNGSYTGNAYMAKFVVTNPNSYFYTKYKGIDEQTVSTIQIYLHTGAGGNTDISNTEQEIQDNLHLRLQ